MAAAGGNRGGRARKDGLAPGSDAAKEADKKYDRDRKQAAREEAAKLAEPPPLPSAVPTGTDTSQATPGPGLNQVPGPDLPPVAWQPETLSGLVDELIEAAEEGRVESYLRKCTEAGLTGKLAKEIEVDARFPKSAKALLKLAIPRLAAKWLNKTGISAEYQDEIAVLTAVILIVKHEMSVRARFEELIVEFKKAKVPPAPAPAPRPQPPQLKP
jgi:hypothetical protein